MKKQIRLLPLLAILWATSTAHAQVVYQFSADDGDPSAQGFAQSGSGSVSSIATTYLNESIWRVEDADEDNTGYQYTHEITTEEVSTLQERGYRVSARFAFLDTDYNDSQSCNVYFADGTRRFLVWIDEAGSGDLVVNLTTDGEAIPINLGSADVNGFYNIDIDVEPGGTTAKLLVNGEVKYSGWGGDANENRFLRFGNGSTSGRGAAGWNRVQIASRVPESDMTFVYLSGTDSYELDLVSNVAGHLHVPDTFDDGANGEKNVIRIGNYACSPGLVGRKNLLSLRLPSQLSSIGTSAFYGCSGFTGSLTLPASLQIIGDSAFQSCSRFTGSLTIPEGVTVIGSSAFNRCSGFTGSLTIPEGVTVISSSAFRDCSGFTGSLTLPPNLQTIGGSAFYECSGLTGSLTIPEGVTSIGNHAFNQCSGFTGSLTLPTSLQSIGSYAFFLCSGLNEVCWLGAPPTTYSTTPFLSTSATHYVPAAYLDEYQALAGLEGAQIKPVTHTTLLAISPSLVGSEYKVTYLAHSGYIHQPQVSTDLESWGSYSSSITGNDQTNHFTFDPAHADLRYFRVQSYPQE